MEGLKKPTKQSVKQKLKMEIGYIRYRVANQLASSNPSLKLNDQRLSNILSTLNTPTHPPYALMINSAIAALNEEGGTSESNISAFIAKTYENLPLAHEAILKHHLRILCERREVACTDDELYILLTNSGAENGTLKTKPGKRKRGRQRGIGIGGPSKSKRKKGGGENQLMVLESEGVIEAIQDQSKRTGTKSDNRDPNLNEGVKEVAQAKQLGTGSEQSEPHSVQTDLSENQLQLEAAEPSGKGQPQVKPVESKKPSLLQRRKLNTQVETQRRKLRSYSRHSAESDTDGTTPKPPLPAHQAKPQEEEKDKLRHSIVTSSEKESSLSRPLPRRTLRSCSKLPPVPERPVPTLTLSIVLSEDPPEVQGDPPNLKPYTALAVSNPLDDPSRKKRGRPRKVNSEAATMPLALRPPKRDGRGRPRKVKPEAEAELALASPPPKRDGRGRPRKLKPDADAELASDSPPPKRDGRGRPKKPEADAELALASRSVKRGRPKKAPKITEMPLAVFRPGSDDDHGDHKFKGRPAKSKSKTGTEMVVFRPDGIEAESENRIQARA